MAKIVLEVQNVSVLPKIKEFLASLNGVTISSVEDNVSQEEHEFVDLGLPSGLKWAKMNVGAKKETDYGSYFAWGEVETKLKYNQGGKEGGSITYGKSSAQLEQAGIIDSSHTLTLVNDAAAHNWGGKWRMPTKSEFQELLDNCDWEWTTMSGVDGYKVSSKKDGNTNWIFLPAAGRRNGTSCNNVGYNGDYWSSTVYESNSNNAYYLDFFSSSESTGYDHRYYGYTVRPVSE